MYKKSALTFLCIIALCLSGCISWVETDAPVKKKLYTVSIPEHWLVINYTADHIKASRNGSFLESVEVNFWSYKTKLPNSEKQLSSDMLPLELVEAIITDMKASEVIFDVELVSSSPRENNGKDGYRYELTYRTQEGLRVGRIEDGYLTQKGLVRAIYEAPLRHYFKAHKEQAVWMLDTLTLN